MRVEKESREGVLEEKERVEKECEKRKECEKKERESRE